MSEISATMSHSMWQRFFNRADADASGTISKQEYQTLSKDTQPLARTAEIFASFDGNGDGQISLAELPKSQIAAEMLYPLLDAQEHAALGAEGQRADDQAVVATLFARADVDGNGVLSKEEWATEKAVRAVAAYDGQRGANDQVFALRPGANPDALKPEDFMVAWALGGDLPLLNIEDLPEDVQEMLRRAEAQLSSSTGSSGIGAEEAQSQRLANMQTDIEKTPMTTSLTSRLFAQLVASVTQDAFDIEV